MGKKRIIKKSGRGLDAGRKERALSKVPKHHMEKGVLHIAATFNNTKAEKDDGVGKTKVFLISRKIGTFFVDFYNCNFLVKDFYSSLN